MSAFLASPWFLPVFFGLCAAWVALAFLFGRVGCFREKPLAAAHQIVVFVPFVFLAVDGTWIWFFDQDFVSAIGDDKIYGYYPPSYHLVQFMLAFQIWDIIVTVLMAREVRGGLKGQVQHLVHHGSSAFLILLALFNGPHGFLMYQAPFFFGVSEISSLPLAFMDLFKYSKELSDKHPAIKEAITVSFALLFLVVRCVYWPFVTVDFWLSMYASTAPWWLKAIWYFFNVGLTLLQYYWGYLIVKAIIKKLKGGETGGGDAREVGEDMQPITSA